MKIFSLLGNKIHNKPKYVQPKMKVVPFEDLKLGKEINSGYTATVYKLKGFKSLVVKTTKFDTFPPKNLQWEINPYTHSVITQPLGRGSSVIMERVEGKPLYGKDWNALKTLPVFKYKKQLKQLLKVPDEAYADYMKQIIELRKHGYDIDSINPNNILYNPKNKRFGVVDISKVKTRHQITMNDFFPFVDDSRLFKIYRNSSNYNRSQLIKLIKKFFDKMLNIASKNGYKLKVEEHNPYKLQNASVYLYHNLRDTLDRLASRSFR